MSVRFLGESKALGDVLIHVAADDQRDADLFPKQAQTKRETDEERETKEE